MEMLRSGTGTRPSSFNDYHGDGVLAFNSETVRLSEMVFLGKGSFGKVYRSFNGQFGEIALKVIPKKDNNSTALQQEVKIVNKIIESVGIETIHIVKFYKVEEYSEAIHILMELCEKGSLHDHLLDPTDPKKQKKLMEVEAVNIMKEVVEGMVALKRHCIIHRDLKPENVLNKGGVWKVSDFGLSRILESGHQILSAPGSLGYMSPEVLTNRVMGVTMRRAYDYNADIWSLGVMFFEMLHGMVPFFGQTYEAIRENILNSDIDGRIDALRASRSVKQILKKMLRVEPDSRIDVESLFDELNELDLTRTSNESATSYKDMTTEVDIFEITSESVWDVSPDKIASYPHLNTTSGNGEESNRQKKTSSNLSKSSTITQHLKISSMGKLENFLKWELGKMRYLRKAVMESLPIVMEKLGLCKDIDQEITRRYVIERVRKLKEIFSDPKSEIARDRDLRGEWELFYKSEGFKELIDDLVMMMKGVESTMTGESIVVDYKALEAKFTKAIKDVCEKIGDDMNSLHFNRVKNISRPLSMTFKPDSDYFFDFEKFYYEER